MTAATATTDTDHADRKFTRAGRRGAGSTSGLRRKALPYLADLRWTTGLSAHLGVLQGAQVRYVEQVSDRQTVGPVAPMHCTAAGKVLLAFTPRKEGIGSARLSLFTPSTITTSSELHGELEQIRWRGVALDDEEYVTGIRCVAAPLIGPDGTAVAALSVCGPAEDVDPGVVSSVVRRVADVCSHSLRVA